MNNADLIPKIHNTMYQQCQQRGYAAPVDVLMDIGVLPRNKYEDWRYGRVPYLESVCTVNLSKLSFIMKQMRVYAKKAGLKPSFCYYKQWAQRRKQVRGTDPSCSFGSAEAAVRKLKKAMPRTMWIWKGRPG